MRSIVVMLALVGCYSPRPLCYELSTSPDGRYKLEARGNGAANCRSESGFVLLREVESGKVLDEVPSETLELRASDVSWWRNAVSFTVRERGVWEHVNDEVTIELP